MPKKETVLLILFILIGWGSAVYAQEPAVPVTIDEAVAETLRNNKSILVSQTDEKIAERNFRQTNAVFLPQVNVSYTAMTSNNPLNVFGFRLQQQSVTASDFDPALLNNPSATQNYMTRADVQMPLLNVDMLYMRKAAQKQIEMYHLKAGRTREYVMVEVQNAYLQVQLSYEAVWVLEEAFKSAKATYEFTDNRFQKGLLQKSDMLNAKIQVTAVERDLAEAKSSVQNASDFLGVLMGKPVGTTYSVGKMSGTVQVTGSAHDVPAMRKDFQAMEIAIEAADYASKSGSMSYLPKLNAFGTYQLNDREALGFGSNAYLVGVQLSWDIFKGTKTKYNIDSKRLERDKLRQQLDEQKDKGRMELAKIYRQLADAQVAIQQQQAAVEHAEEALRILSNRYQQGLVITTDVLMAGTQLSQQRLGLARAIFKYHVTTSYLQFLTSSSN